MMHRVSLATYQVALAALIFSPPSLALGQAYYQGKTITILQGTSPGGSSDMLTRSVIPLLPQIRDHRGFQKIIRRETIAGAISKNPIAPARNIQIIGRARLRPTLGEEARKLDMKKLTWSRILGSALLIQLMALPDFLYGRDEFYKGKTLRIIQGRNAGGSATLRRAPWSQCCKNTCREIRLSCKSTCRGAAGERRGELRL